MVLPQSSSDPVVEAASHVLSLVVFPQPSSDPVVEAASQAACVGRRDAGMEWCLSGNYWWPLLCASTPPRHQVVDRHRLRSSPIDSPSKHGHSPAFKCIIYARSFSEAIHIGEVSESVFQAPEPMNISTTPCSRPRILGNVLYEDFLQSQEEAMALSKLKKWIFTYVLHKRTLKPDHLLLSFKEHVASLQGSDIHAEPAVVLYLSILTCMLTPLKSCQRYVMYKEYIATTSTSEGVQAAVWV